MAKNKGYSLIELVVVIAIMAIISGGSILSFRIVGSYYSKQCAKKMEAQLNKVQIQNMSKKVTELEFGQDATGNYYATVTDNVDPPETVKIGRSSLKVTYSVDDKDANVFELKAGNPLKIQFDRTTGGLKRDGSGKLIGCHRIWIRQGVSQKYYTVTVNELTGKIEVTADMVKYEAP